MAPRAARAQAPAYPTDPDREPLQTDSAPLAVDREYPAELALPPVAALLQAGRLARVGQHLEAALLLEAQWAATGDPRIGYHAARERSRAGHHALALAHLLRVLEQGATLSPAARDHVTAKLAEERAQTRQVRVRLVEAVPGGVVDLPPAALAGSTLGLTPADRPTDYLGFTPIPGDPIGLDVRAWHLSVAVPGYLPRELDQSVEPGGETSTWTIELVRRPVEVLLRFSPARAGRGTQLRLTATDRYPSPILEHRATGPTTRVTMTAGLWELEASNGRYRALQRLTIAAQQGPIDVDLRKSGDPPRFTRDRKLALAMLGGFSASYVVGIGLILGGASKGSRIEKRNDALLTAEGLDPKADTQPDPAALARIDAAYPTRDYHRDLRATSRLQGAGIQVSFAGIGAVLSALPVVIGARKRVALIELGAGAALLTGGSVWLAHVVKTRAERLAPDARRITNSEFDKLTLGQLGASLLTGVGASLVFFPALALIVDAATRRKAQRRFTLEPGPGPGLVGGSLRARF